MYDRRASAWRFEGLEESDDKAKTIDGHRPPLQLEFIGPEVPLVLKPGWTDGTVWLDSGGKKAAVGRVRSNLRRVPKTDAGPNPKLRR